MSSVLYLGSSEQQLWRRDGDTWQQISGSPDGPVWIVTNLPEESFTELRMPRLFGLDRTAFIDRQLSAAYPDTPYRSFLTPPVQDSGLLGKLIPTRQILFGINAVDRLNNAIAELNAPIAGIWPISMLLARVCQRKEMPSSLLVAMPGPDSLRIVFLKNRTPVLTRLTATPDDPVAQVEEVVRTLRYLENAQILPRNRSGDAVLFLGATNALQAPIEAARLTLVGAEKNEQTTADWRSALFDIVVKSPPGQVAPLEKRIDYVSARLATAARVAAAVLLAVGLAFAGFNAFSSIALLREKSGLDESIAKITTKNVAIAEQIGRFKVSPDQVRSTIALNEKEITSVPPLEQHLQLIANALAVDPSLRLLDFQWRLLPPAALPCSTAADASQVQSSDALPETEQRKIEISFEVAVPSAYGPRERATTLQNISNRLAGTDGLTVWQDANKNFLGGSLRGGLESAAGDKLIWCITLPGITPPAADVSVPAAKASS